MRPDGRSSRIFKNQPGARRGDDRRISGILHVLKVGCRSLCAGRIRSREDSLQPYHRWARRRIWHRIFEKMAANGPLPQELSIDRTHIKAHRSAQGSKTGGVPPRDTTALAPLVGRSSEPPSAKNMKPSPISSPMSLSLIPNRCLRVATNTIAAENVNLSTSTATCLLLFPQMASIRGSVWRKSPPLFPRTSMRSFLAEQVLPCPAAREMASGSARPLGS